MSKRSVLLLLIIIALSGVVSACSGNTNKADQSTPAASSSNATIINLELNEFSFSKKEIKVKQGETVHFVLKNSGQYPHDISSEELQLDKDVDAGKTEEFDWTVPKDAGTYTIICDKPGHKDKGMTMTMIIE